MILLIGLMIGAVLGLTGAGGSVLAVPLLILLMGLNATDAMGLPLGAVAASATYGAILQRKNILWLPAMALAVGGMLAGPLGKYVALQFNEQWLLMGFSVLAILIAVKMWRQAIKNPEQTQVVRAGATAASDEQPLCRLSQTGQFQLKPRCLTGLALGGFGVGFASGLFGVGGGFLIVPLLLFLSQISMARAVASSLLAITLISSSGFVSHLWLAGMPAHSALWPLLGASLAGMLISQMVSRYIAGPVMQKVFALLLVVVSGITLVKAFI